MERPRHNGLRHLALNARDLDAMKRFYVDLLGFEVEWEPDPDNVYLSSGADNLALHRAAPGGAGGPGGGCLRPSRADRVSRRRCGSVDRLPGKPWRDARRQAENASRRRAILLPE